MVPAAFTEQTVTDVAAVLERRRFDHRRRQLRLARRHPPRHRTRSPQSIDYLDVGTSGGRVRVRARLLPHGRRRRDRGRRASRRCSTRSVPASKPRHAHRVAPASRHARSGAGCTAGPSGAGHFVKMVHNGIEYGIMAAYAEGLAVLHHANEGKNVADVDAETAPLSYPELYQYDLDIPAVTEVWRRGSVIASWLLDLTAAAFVESPDLQEFSGRVSDSGEGRWTAEAAIVLGVPTPVLTARVAIAVRVAGCGHVRGQGAVGATQAVRRPRREAGLGRMSRRCPIHVGADVDEAAAQAARMIGNSLRDAIAARGRATRSPSVAARRRGRCCACWPARRSTGSSSTSSRSTSVSCRAAIPIATRRTSSRRSCGSLRCRSRDGTRFPSRNPTRPSAARHYERTLRDVLDGRPRRRPPRVSATTGTPRRSCPATPCSVSPTGSSRRRPPTSDHRRVTLTYPAHQRGAQHRLARRGGGQGRDAAPAGRGRPDDPGRAGAPGPGRRRLRRGRGGTPARRAVASRITGVTARGSVTEGANRNRFESSVRRVEEQQCGQQCSSGPSSPCRSRTSSPPPPGPRDVVVEIGASGVCHSDLSRR